MYINDVNTIEIHVFELHVVASFQCYVSSSIKEEGLKTSGLNGHSNLIQV